MCLAVTAELQMKQTIDEVDRRTVLRGVGTVALTGSLAGCGGSDDGGNGGGDGDLPSKVTNYLSGANNFGGSATEKTDADSVTVKVGAGNGLAFGPAAVRISTGTTVTWEWTGSGGGHNVVHEDGEFTSGEDYISESGHTYKHTFESAGSYRYYCVPHKASGMKGAVIVEGSSDETTE